MQNPIHEDRRCRNPAYDPDAGWVVPIKTDSRPLDMETSRRGEEELEDLVNLAVNGEILDPASALGEHVNDCWPALVGPAERSLVHWLRRLVFRGAWLDQRVNEGELSVAFDEDTGSFAYVQPASPRSASSGEPIELAPEPSWGRVAYRR